MSKHKPAHGGHKVNKQARQQRKITKRKLYVGLRKDPRTGRRARG